MGARTPILVSQFEIYRIWILALECEDFLASSGFLGRRRMPLNHANHQSEDFDEIIVPVIESNTHC